MPIINKTAVLIPFSDLTAKEYSDRLVAIEAQAASTLATQKSEVAASIAQVSLTQSQTITALTLEVSNLKTNLTDTVTTLINSATTTQTELVNRADQLAQDVTDITVQLTQDKATFTQEIQDALDFLKGDAFVAPALRTPRKINGTDFDGRSDITTNAWGATRTFKIGNKTNSINGTSNVAYSLADIGAFPDVGGTIQGTVEVTGNLSVGGTISATLEGTAARADKLQVARKIQGVDFDGTKDISLPTFTTQTDGLVPKRVGVSTTKYLREDGTWVVPPDTTYALLTAADAEDGTATTANTISAQVLKDAIQYHAPTVANIAGNAGTATKLQTPRTISLTGKVTGSVSFDGSNNASISTAITELGVANGIATLDSSGKVPSAQLPSFTSGEVSSVAGKTGVVTLSKADVGLTNVDNTADSSKSVASASKLTTARTIGGVSFDGSAKINLPGVNTTGNQSTTGNASTATTLQTARTINGTSFNGSADITTTNWGTVRTFTLGSTSKSVNGSADVSWSADEILPNGTNGQVLKHNGTSWVSSTDSNAAYTAMTATTANAGTATTAQIISPSVLKQAIQTHAPTGGGGMNFAAKVEIELEIILDFSSGNYHTSGNILSVSNQANIASAVLDGNGILCLTFNTPISNPNLIATTKNEVKTVTHEGVDYSYLTSTQNGNFNYSMGNYESYGIFQYAENGYVNTNTKLYISCNLYVYPNYGGTSMLRSTFPARFNLGIIDA